MNYLNARLALVQDIKTIPRMGRVAIIDYQDFHRRKPLLKYTVDAFLDERETVIERNDDRKTWTHKPLLHKSLYYPQYNINVKNPYRKTAHED